MTKLEAFRWGALVSIPMIIGGVPFGVLFGSLAVSLGVSPWIALAMSMLVFAGSSQFVGIGLLAAGAPAWVVISTTFIINLRHVLYAADLLKHVKHLSLAWRGLLAFGLIDEVYAAIKPHYATGKLDNETGHWAYLGSFLAFYVMWVTMTLVGILAGRYIPDMSQWGLEFAMVATFVGIITPYLTSWPYWGAFVVSSLAALVLTHLPHNLGLLVAALMGVGTGLLTDRMLRYKRLMGESS